MSPLYRRRPSYVEAWQWTGTLLDARRLLREAGVPVNMGSTTPARLAFWCEKSAAQVHISPGDWVIREPDGSGFYSCADAVFIRSYVRQEV